MAELLVNIYLPWRAASERITQYKEKINCKNYNGAEMILMLTSVSVGRARNFASQIFGIQYERCCEQSVFTWQIFLLMAKSGREWGAVDGEIKFLDKMHCCE